MQEESQKKKRQEPRLIVDISASYKLEKSKDYVECRIVDISALGIGVEIKSFLEAGEKLRLKFSLGEKNLELDCIVRHILGKTTGLSYKNMEHEEVEYIRNYVRKKFFDRVKK